MTAEAVHAAAIGFRHGFFTRRGGVSAGPYASLNCSLSGRDSRDAVLENRARAARAVGADPATLVGLMQVHSAIAVHVEAPWLLGAGTAAPTRWSPIGPASRSGWSPPTCAPVLFADTAAGAAGAGWRGALAGVLETTVDAMAALGAQGGADHRGDRAVHRPGASYGGGSRSARRWCWRGIPPTFASLPTACGRGTGSSTSAAIARRGCTRRASARWRC